jgi:hypothetical protein
MARSLEEQLNGADPEPWMPEEAGESIFGEIEAISTREGDWGPYPVITLLTADGEVWNVAGFGTVLHNDKGTGKFDGITDADVGRQLGVKYLGEKTPKKGGKDYKDYRVVLSARVPVTAGGVTGVDEFPDEDI